MIIIIKLKDKYLILNFNYMFIKTIKRKKN